MRKSLKRSKLKPLYEAGRENSYGIGIDFTKTVVVNDEKYVGEDALINNKEYIENKR